VLQYLGPYTQKVMALGVDEFLRRFLLHIVPARFMRIRHLGLPANRGRVARLARCRHLLLVPPAPAVSDPPTDDDAMLALLRRCPVCHVGHWLIVEILPRVSTPGPGLPPDSS
jgi:hypothetical protein